MFRDVGNRCAAIILVSVFAARPAVAQQPGTSGAPPATVLTLHARTYSPFVAAAHARERGAVRDEIGQMTRALNSLIDRLQVALDANRRFAADAAHELRTPVTAIAGEIDVAFAVLWSKKRFS